MGHYDEQRETSAEKWRDHEKQLKEWGKVLSSQSPSCGSEIYLNLMSSEGEETVSLSNLLLEICKAHSRLEKRVAELERHNENK